MTIPTLMNCAHSPDSWCLACVGELATERDALNIKLDEHRDLCVKRVATLTTERNLLKAKCAESDITIAALKKAKS